MQHRFLARLDQKNYMRLFKASARTKKSMNAIINDLISNASL